MFSITRNLRSAFLVAMLSSAASAAPEPFEGGCLISGAPSVSSVSLKKVASGFTKPVAILFSPVDKTEYFVIEQIGLIRKVKSGVVQSLPVLDLRAVVNGNDNETGLLGMAFHPNFRNNRRIFLNYTTLTRPRTVIAEFMMEANGVINRTSEKIILEIAQPFSNHNGGDLKFGPDGYLYIGTGDGGSANDPQRNGQNLKVLLAKMLRIDIDSGAPYKIPRDNPIFSDPGARKEIYAYGLRNPWRFSFDKVNGQLWAADVGQNALEEIDIIKKGANYGWNTMEGTRCFLTNSCNRSGLELPVHEYPRTEGVSITGGYVYRGLAIPTLIGRYLFADYGSGKLWGLNWDGTAAANKLLLETSFNISTFGEDSDGEIYVADHRGGNVYRIEKGSNTPGNFPYRLSDTGCFDSLNPLRPAPGVVGYDVKSQLWSDGAIKSRFAALPAVGKIMADQNGGLTFPEGTLLIKHFYLPVRENNQIHNRITETRFLVKNADGFKGYTYKWNEAETDADFIGGASHVPVTMATSTGDVRFNYYIPGSGDCNRCHSAASGGAAGFTVAHLNFDMPTDHGQENQLQYLSRSGLLDISALPGDLGLLPTLVDPFDGQLNLQVRARSWLHTNCSGCHNPVSGTATGNMDFRASIPLAAMKICGVNPQHGDIGIGNARLLDPGHPEKSLVWARIHSENLEVRMPPVASSRRDQPGSELIRSWIAELSDCVSGH